MKAKVIRGGWSHLGRSYKAGDTVEAKPSLIQRWADGGYVEPMKGSKKVERAEAAPDAEKATAPPDGPEKWTLKTSPEEYLERFPDGPNADLARAHLED